MFSSLQCLPVCHTSLLFRCQWPERHTVLLEPKKLSKEEILRHVTHLSWQCYIPREGFARRESSLSTSSASLLAKATGTRCYFKPFRPFRPKLNFDAIADWKTRWLNLVAFGWTSRLQESRQWLRYRQQRCSEPAVLWGTMLSYAETKNALPWGVGCSENAGSWIVYGTITKLNRELAYSPVGWGLVLWNKVWFCSWHLSALRIQSSLQKVLQQAGPAVRQSRLNSFYISEGELLGLQCIST